MAEWRRGTGDAGIADQDIELAVTFMQRRAQPRYAFEIRQVERHQRGGAAVPSDLVVEFFQPALRPRQRDDVRTGPGKRPRGRIADAARGAGDESDTGGEGL